MQQPTHCPSCNISIKFYAFFNIINSTRIERYYYCECGEFSFTSFEERINVVKISEGKTIRYFWKCDAEVKKIMMCSVHDILHEEITSIDSMNEFEKRIEELSKAGLFV